MIWVGKPLFEFNPCKSYYECTKHKSTRKTYYLIVLRVVR